MKEYTLTNKERTRLYEYLDNRPIYLDKCTALSHYSLNPLIQKIFNDILKEQVFEISSIGSYTNTGWNNIVTVKYTNENDLIRFLLLI